ncbi:hypothetical protein CHLNCDRAFT_138485 [Chlorella variabilis]|uniref:HIT-type domain-containing protein n=1 Tax=Chlorella variabilis TaxID=554065 RepID=E1ZN58_CHLVA|nr:hypothetical protein CHLNCDRAFT_138485 [Chlorella variabilis]EFN52815.1 hypothetical protein CHLNCDRAFT_138485 [Chlorella variabilis]|eukprot:XP_005844917.1 hypothetical protein CHLNCDRAFT_138485 [Chlorella variabilis]
MEKRTLRSRKVSERMAVVDEADRRRVIQARLAALEEDNHKEDDFAAGSDDDEFELPKGSDDDGDEGPASGRKKKKVKVGGGMRKTRGMIADKSKGPKAFRDYLEEAELERLPEGTPSYLTAAVGPARTAAPRKFCSVCGDVSTYTCTRCGSRFCSRRCHAVHTETRCLKFTA